MEETQKEAPLLTPILRWFMLAMVLANISGDMGMMLTPLYLSNMGASITEIGFVFTILSVVSLVLQVFGGWVSDSIGRLKAIAIGSVGGVVGSFLIVLAPTWQWLILALVISRIPRAMVGPSFGAFIAENSKEENRGRVYGITDMIYQICGIVGPPLGGFLAGQYGYKLMFLVAAILYSLAAGLRIWMATTMTSARSVGSQDLSWNSFKLSIRMLVGMIAGGGILTWIFLTDGIRDAAYSLSREIEPLYLEQIGGLSTQEIGMVWSVFSIAMLFTPMISGRLSDRHGERVPISMGFFFIFVAFSIFLNVTGFLPFVVVWVIFGLGVGLLSPAYSSLISKVVPHDKLGAFNGIFYGSIGLLALPAPYLGTLMWEKISPRAPFFVAAVVSFLTIFPIWFKFKVPEKTDAAGQEAAG
ncbi:MAG TPA: MFS transporter [Anaerolineae bacterium]|nr:MFS transporter [Anaerolineae bacterium]